MTTEEALMFLRKLQESYERFRMPQPLAHMWVKELALVEVEDMEEAFRRYVLDNHPAYAPTLNRLLDLADTVQRERRANELLRLRQEQEPRDLGQILHDVASRVSEPDAAWAQGHVALFLSGAAAPGRGEDAARFCLGKAEEFPDDADCWRRAAVEWRRDRRRIGAAIEGVPF